MEIVECLNDTKTVVLSCESTNITMSQCVCAKRPVENNIILTLKNTNLYLNPNTRNTPDMNITDYQYNDTIARINDCLRFDNVEFWNCRTELINSSQTFCWCYLKDGTISFQSYIPTKSLFKGLENFIFPIDELEIEITTDQTTDSETTRVFNESYNHNYLINDDAIALAFTLMPLIILMVIFICWIFSKNKIPRKCFSAENDLMNLISEIELQSVN